MGILAMDFGKALDVDGYITIRQFVENLKQPTKFSLGFTPFYESKTIFNLTFP